MRRNLLTCSWGSSMVRIFWISLRLSSSALRLSSSALLLFSCLLFSARLSFLSSWRRFSTMLSRLRSSLLLEFWRLILVPASGLRGAGDLPDEVDLELLLPVLLTFWVGLPADCKEIRLRLWILTNDFHLTWIFPHNKIFWAISPLVCFVCLFVPLLVCFVCLFVPLLVRFVLLSFPLDVFLGVSFLLLVTSLDGGFSCASADPSFFTAEAKAMRRSSKRAMSSSSSSSSSASLSSSYWESNDFLQLKYSSNHTLEYLCIKQWLLHNLEIKIIQFIPLLNHITLVEIKIKS